MYNIIICSLSDTSDHDDVGEYVSRIKGIPYRILATKLKSA